MFRAIAAGLLAAGLFILPGCEVEQTQPGRAPNVDVDVKGDAGKVPKYEVDGPDVDVRSRETTVRVPDIDINSEEKNLNVPDVDVSLPGDKDNTNE
jgi:hypothetical protein